MTQNHTRRGLLAAGATVGLVGLTTVAAIETPAISPELERLLEAHQQAYDNFYSVPDETPDDVLGAFGTECHTSADALCAYRCRTIEEARVWAATIAAYVERSDWYKPAGVALRALAGLPAQEEA